tara:strand:+ start:257 stop:433 length:177 start_codon:yes stop_codon:yes gene_type:complete
MQRNRSFGNGGTQTDLTAIRKSYPDILTKLVGDLSSSWQPKKSVFRIGTGYQSLMEWE